MKIHPVGAELFHADRRTNGRTHMTKLIVAFRNFVNSPNNHSLFIVVTGLVSGVSILEKIRNQNLNHKPFFSTLESALVLLISEFFRDC